MFAMFHMICFVVVLFAVVQSKPDIDSFRNYLRVSGHDLGSISRVEKIARYRLFAASSSYVEAQNQLHAGYTSTLNKFAVMTPAERALYHGVNRTESGAEEPGPWTQHGAAPSSVSWVDKGHVTSVKNQDGCGACWTFGPVVAIEGAYKKLTGKLKQFSNQELLDCVYDAHTYNACHGGTETRAFQFLIRRKRLALWAEYPYEPVDKRCRSAGKQDGFKAARVAGFTKNDGTESSTIARLAQGPLSVAFHAVLSVHYYKSGIYKSEKCGTVANHAVAAIAYTPTYILIKNSWGADWGDQGLFKFARHNTACGIHLPDNNFMVEMQATGLPDNDPEDRALVYDKDSTPTRAPTDGPTDGPAPTDDNTTTQRGCHDKIEGCMSMFCGFYSSYKTDCRKTCGYC